ncbi:hypothetical protein ABZ249_25445 [Nocardiopsis sp. NPDC006139]|uniref:hypothetical protein n=1 Tax=Nocardiopsis sp. NPDC006139 TaxID=3154578 RepID=UPI0033B42ECA
MADRPRTRAERAAFLCMTLEELDQLDALSALIHRERVAAPRMAARYDEACANVAELHEETVRQRRRIAALEDQLADAQALADRRWVAWHSARRRAEAYGEGIVRLTEDRDAWKGWCKAAEERLAATTAPHRAEARLADDAQPTTGGGQ